MAVFVTPTVVEAAVEAAPILEAEAASVGSGITGAIEAGWDSLHRAGSSIVDWVRGTSKTVGSVSGDIVSATLPVVGAAATVGTAVGAAQTGYSMGSHLLYFGVAILGVNILNSLGSEAKRRRIG